MYPSCSAAESVVSTNRREVTERKYFAKRKSISKPFKDESVMKVSYSLSGEEGGVASWKARGLQLWATVW